jgi:IS5 family transposase
MTGKFDSTRHLVTDRQGIPLMFCASRANRHDAVVFEEPVDAAPSVASKRGRPRRWPDKVHADKGYGFACTRQRPRKRGIPSRIACRGIKCNDRSRPHR